MIDVAALDSHNLQQHEYVEKMKQYSQRVQRTCTQNISALKTTPCLLQDISVPDKILSSEPISIEDRNLVIFLILINLLTFQIMFLDDSCYFKGKCCCE